MQKSRGYYFLADDKMYDYVITFLNSFKKFNPDAKLSLVPFNSRISKIKQLQKHYGFDIYQDDEKLKFFDHISHEFHHKTIGHYRKLACWFGSFDEFIYLDIDTIIQRNLNDLFDYLANYDYVTATSNHLSIRRWVWKNSVDDLSAVHGLSRKQIDYGANTGFIISHKSILSVELIKQLLIESKSAKEYMFLGCLEQPFLNYVITKSSHKYTSLFEQRTLTDDHLIPLERFAGLGQNIVKDLVLLRMNDNGNIYPDNPTLVVHFCGHNLNVHKGFDKRLQQLWCSYRDLDLKYKRSLSTIGIDYIKSILFTKKIMNFIRKIYLSFENNYKN